MLLVGSFLGKGKFMIKMKRIGNHVFVFLLLAAMALSFLPQVSWAASYEKTEVKEYVERLYTTILDCQPDAEGLEFWYGQLVSQKKSGSQVAFDFVFSPEFKEKRKVSDREFVEILYRGLLGRKSDADGRAYWVAMLSQGYTREDVFAGIADLEEFRKVCVNYKVGFVSVKDFYPDVSNKDFRRFVQRCYTVVQKRSPDTNGTTYWVNRLANGAGMANVLHGFIFSPEQQAKKLSNEQFITMLYQAVLDRSPDSEGYNYWIRCLNNGASREVIFWGFTNSDEFRNLAYQYGEIVPVPEEKLPGKSTVVSLQAYTDICFYGQKLTEVVIQYEEGTDLSKIPSDGSSYTIWDRGYSTPDYAKAEIIGAVVNTNDRTVTLKITIDEEATGERSKNPVGVLATGSWYMDFAGEIYSGAAESVDALTKDVYHANTTNNGYYTRKELDLVLGHGKESLREGMALTDGRGNYTAANKWQKTIHKKYEEFKDVEVDVNAFVSEYLGSSYTAAGYKAFDGKVPVKYYLPKNYDANRATGYPLAVYVTGAGTSYWEMYDASGRPIANNYGTNITFDNAAGCWMGQDVIVISPHVHSTQNENAAQEVAGVIDYFVKNYHVDTDQIILNGNSNGTVICSEVIRQFPGLCDAFICNNGRLGTRPDGSGETYAKGDALAGWTEEEIASLAENGLAFWLINGETDSSHPLICQNEFKKLVTIYKGAGWSDEWIQDNLRISAYPSWKFKYWGETDHSCTKVTYWYYFNKVYTDVYKDGKALKAGDTYTLPGKESFDYYGAETYEYMVYGESVGEWALSRTAGSSERNRLKASLVSLNNYPVPEIDITAASLLPLNGYFQQTVEAGGVNRQVKLYIPEGAPIRAFFHVITVPDGMDTEDFLLESGWIDIADETVCGLYILEAGQGGWSDFDDELAYVNAAMTNLTKTTYYSTMGSYYLVGYGTGGTALQGWAVNNPLFVISQAYVDTNDLDAYYLNRTGSQEYGDQIARYDNVSYNDIPVPTWIVNSKLAGVANVVNYWKNANDCTALGTINSGLLGSRVYAQKQNSDAWPTRYSGPISQLASLQVSLDPADPAVTKTINEFLTYYTRYDTTSVYGNGLGIRGSYEVQTIEMAEPDGRTWIREYITYVPSSYTGEEAVSVVYAFGGNTQTGRVYFEASQWWVVAEEYGFIVVMPSSQYSSATAATWNPANMTTETMANDYAFIEAVIKEIDQTYHTDTSKRYATGQSMGSMMAQRMSFYLPDYFAAIGSSSGTLSVPFAPDVTDGDNGVIPVYFIMGENDNSDYDFTVAGGDMYKQVDYWTVRNETSPVMEWDSEEVSGRFHTYTWNNRNDIPLYRYTWTEGRNHNNIHAEAKLLWSTWFSFWSMDAQQNRYYEDKLVTSEEAFEEAVTKLTPESIPATDPSKGIQAPIRGYYEQDITVSNEITRTAKVYISENAKYGDYFVILNAPAGERTTSFLQDSGWMDLADENCFNLFVLEPANGTWGTDIEESAYMAAAYKTLMDGLYYRPAGCYYAVGYGDAGRLLQQLVMKNPLTIASAAFIDASNISSEYLTEAGDSNCDTKTNVTCREVPTPVWIISEEMNENTINVINYWKYANGSQQESVDFALESKVFKQGGTRTRAFTNDADICQVAVKEGKVDIKDANLAKTIYEQFLSKYLTYGSVATGWMTGERTDYDALGVETKTFTLDGYEREYMVYVPDSVRNSMTPVPVVFAAPGSGSADAVMFDTSMWWKTAQAQHFIVVTVTAVPGERAAAKIGTIGWDTSGERDIAYVAKVVEAIKQDYPIADASRIYFTGQSQGCVFVSHVGTKLPELFAAFAGTSGPLYNVEITDQAQVPYYLLLGEFDNSHWNYSEAGSQVRTQLEYWININQAGDIDQPVNDVTNGRYQTLTWENSDGIPMVQLTRTFGRGHSTIADECNLMWNFLQNYRVVEEMGVMVHYYIGQQIQRQVTSILSDLLAGVLAEDPSESSVDESTTVVETEATQPVTEESSIEETEEVTLDTPEETVGEREEIRPANESENAA